VVTILGLPDVLALARKRDDVDAANRPYISLGAERRYLPEAVKLIPRFYDLSLAVEVQRAFDDSYFNHAFKRPTYAFDDETGEHKSAADAAYNAALSGWLSSPPALADFIVHSLSTEDIYVQLSLERDAALSEDESDSHQFELLSGETSSTSSRSWGVGGYAPFMLGREARQRRLEPIREKLETVPDLKLHELIRIVRACSIEKNDKALIFVRWHRTALYLQANLKKLLPRLQIGCTVEVQQGRPGLKSRHARDEVLRSFSPQITSGSAWDGI
jgi:hypothetical protein